MSKRTNGEGTITKLKNGTYMGRIMLGRKQDGTPNRKSVYGKTKKEVSEKLITIANSVNIGTYIEPTQIILSEWLSNWLSNYKKRDLKIKTYETYDQVIRNNIQPFIGNIKLKDLKVDHIQNLYNNHLEKLASGTIRKVHIVLKSALNQAVKNDMLIKNVADAIKLPRITQKQITIFTQEEQDIFLETAKKSKFYYAFLVNIDTGLRRGELLALTWDDIDFTNNCIHVNKNVIYSKKEFIVQNSTKTKSGMRRIPLTERSSLLLKELKLKQQKISNIVFCTKNGNYILPRNYNSAFSIVLKHANLNKCSPHVLRHTYATRLFETGIQAKTVSELLGHSNITITLNIYTHVLPETKSEAIKALDKLYSNNKPQTNSQTNCNEKSGS